MKVKIPEFPHANSMEAIVEALSADISEGLSEGEVLQRRKDYGRNSLSKEKRKSLLGMLVDQFVDPIIWVLVGAAILGTAFGEYIEAIAVAVVILITVAIGFIMEFQAIRSIRALRKMVETRAVVVREGEEKTIHSTELVPGDLILLKVGEVVPADARIIEHINLGVKEAALTGESAQENKSTEPLHPDIPLGDRKNMVFSGTIITRGEARALVTSTGDLTEMGRISKIAAGAEDEVTPIEKRLAKLSKRLIWLTFFLTLTIVVLGYLQGRELRPMIETAIALAVAAIPEGLPIVAVIALARGMLRLARDRVIIKKLRAVETLGSTTIICTDKTGTLTENMMEVTSIRLPGDSIECLQNDEEQCIAKYKHKKALKRLVEVGLLCNNVRSDAKSDTTDGDPLEVGLIQLGRWAGLNIQQFRNEHPELREIPFDTETKMMLTLNPFGSFFRVSAKGAVENLLEHCTMELHNGEMVPLSPKSVWLDQADSMAGEGLRTLGFAYKDVDAKPDENEMTSDLVFLGIVGFMDPPREDILPAMQVCHRAGIEVVMVTGDHPETARSIAKSVGLIDDDAPPETVVTSRTLSELKNDKEAFEKRLREAVVFARVTPEQKLTLVNFYQENGHIVGMTGDGVNDAPALKKADIGIAMGTRGTEAAKEVADVILKDDQFTSIELAIRQGRIIFSNIRNFVVFLLSCNLSEILSVAIAFLANLPLPLLPLQILYLNLITDVFPALALGMGKGDDRIMHEPPRKVNEPIMTQKMWASTAAYGAGLTAGTIGIVLYGKFYLGLDNASVNNMAFYTLVLGQLLNVFNIPHRGLLKPQNEVTRNGWVWASIILCILLTSLGYLIPTLREVLALVPISFEQFGWVFIFSFASLLLTQVLKWIFRF
jgi:Ca2+-transporting ATPase